MPASMRSSPRNKNLHARPSRKPSDGLGRRLKARMPGCGAGGEGRCSPRSRPRGRCAWLRPPPTTPRQRSFRSGPESCRSTCTKKNSYAHMRGGVRGDILALRRQSSSCPFSAARIMLSPASIGLRGAYRRTRSTVSCPGRGELTGTSKVLPKELHN